MKELLVVVDMQNDFITGVLGTEEAKKVVANVCSAIEGWKGDIVMTRDTHEYNYMSTAEGKMLPVPHCIRDSEGWQINDDVMKSYEKYKSVNGVDSGNFFSILNKPTFGSMRLAYEAGYAQYDRIVLCGVCTDICVLSNAMLIRAALPEAEIIVDASCCAGVTPESHRVALAAMAPCNIKVINN